MDHPSKRVFLAWAVPVDPMAVTASLVAYESTNVAMDTFRSAMHSNSSISRLPPELLLSIENYLLGSYRVDEISKWTVLFRRLTDECCLEHHLTKDDLDELRKTALDDFDVEDPSQTFDEDAFEEFFYDWLYENNDEWGEEHQERLEDLHYQLLGGHYSTLRRAQTLFAKVFGLRVHYDVVPKYRFDDHREAPDAKYAKLMCAHVTAFLTLPRHESEIDSSFGPNKSAFSLRTGIDPPVFTPLRDSERSLFNNALRMFQLKIMSNLFCKNLLVDMTASGIPKSSDKKPLSSSSIEGLEEWPALMLLGSGELETFPVYDSEC